MIKTKNSGRRVKFCSKLPKNLQNSTQATCLQQQFDNSANVHFRVAAGVGARRHLDFLKKWESDKLDRIFAKFVSPGPQTYQIKAKRADVVQTCRFFPMKEPLLKLQTFETKKEDTVKQPF